MSHFAVLVVGNNVEEQLAPYHEFECTGIDDQYVQNIDMTEEVKADGLDYHGFDDRTVEDEADIDLLHKHKYGYAVVDKAGTVLKAIDRTNPNKKWDWFQGGGRWSNWLLLKDGRRTDSATKGEIDFEGMQREAADKGSALYDKVAGILAQHPQVESWESVRARLEIEEARTFYNGQPGVKAVSEWMHKHNYPMGVFYNLSELMVDRKQYIASKAEEATTLFAFVRDSKWAERGNMGWFGCVSNEKDNQTWSSIFNKLLADVPDHELLTVVDCHI